MKCIYRGVICSYWPIDQKYVDDNKLRYDEERNCYVIKTEDVVDKDGFIVGREYGFLIDTYCIKNNGILVMLTKDEFYEKCEIM